jgi:parvulin-like peptidyl-prolyl isomerase
MKTLIAAVIASAVSFGAFAQSASAPAAAPMAAGDSSMKKTPEHKSTSTTKSTKSTKTHAAKKPAHKASAPAA